jgi:hypothetical protein
MLQTRQKSFLTDYVVNKDEYAVINSFENKDKIAKVDKVGSKLVDVLANWRWMAGINPNNQDENEVARELALIAKFIINQYESLTIDEIKLCIDLSLTDKLNVDVRTFNVFSPMYVSRILNAYLDYKRKIYNEVYERKEKKLNELKLNEQPSAEFKRNGLIELIQYVYAEYKEKGTVNDVFNSVYNFLRRTKRLTHDKAMIDEAMEYGKLKSIEEVNNVYGLRVQGRNNINKEAIQKRYARNYCVEKFFNTIDINALILSIEISEFE